MTTSTSPAGDDPTASGPPGGERGLVSSIRERRHPGALAAGLAASVLLHAVLILLYPVLMRSLGPEEDVPGVPAPLREVAGTRIVRLAEVPEEAPGPVEPPPEPVEETAGPEPAPEETGPEEAPPAAEPTTESAAERLRPDLKDPRLWRPPEEALTALTPEEKLQMRLFFLFRAMQDSMVAAEAEAAAITDWTFTDEDGNRWGLSPGKLHLGKITLPLPLSFEGRSDQLGEQDLDAWFREEIERGALDAEILEIWRERAEAIRERKDRERRERTEPDDTTGSRPPPDRL